MTLPPLTDILVTVQGQNRHNDVKNILSLLYKDSKYRSSTYEYKIDIIGT